MKNLTLIILCFSNYFLLFGQNEQKNFCFTFRDNKNEIIKPLKVEIIDNAGSTFFINQNYCFDYVKDSNYSFIIKVEDKDFYFFERQYLAPINLKSDTIILNRIEQKYKYIINIQDYKNVEKELLEFESFLKTRNFYNMTIRVNLESYDVNEIKKVILNLSNIFIDYLIDKNIKNPIITFCFENTEQKNILIELN